MKLDAEDFRMPLGKYKGQTLGEIKLIDESYLIWVYENVENLEVQNNIEAYLEL